LKISIMYIFSSDRLLQPENIPWKSERTVEQSYGFPIIEHVFWETTF